MARSHHFTGWPAVEGYCDHRSFCPGERVNVRCSGRASSMSAVVSRIGAVVEQVWARTNIKVSDTPVPDDAWRSGCDWPATVTVNTERDWPPGLYLITLQADRDDSEKGTAHAFFVLRAKLRLPDTPLLVLATNTWNAYNEWGGRCLYSGADAVSFRRPLERGYLTRATDDDGFDGRIATVGHHDPNHTHLQDYQRRRNVPLWTSSAGWFNWERRFVTWAEQAGFELDFATDLDLHRSSDLLDSRRLLLTVGHSEYWSWAMRDHVDSFIRSGGNWAIFSGNTCFWQVRINHNDVMICHRGAARRNDPVSDSDEAHLLTAMWSDPRIGRPENETIGVSFSRGGYHRVGEAVPRGAGGYTVHRPDHWAFEGTELRYGDLLGSSSCTVGYEVDGCVFETVNGLPIPTGEDGTPTDFEILASAPARLVSINDTVCEAPAELWADLTPPGDLESTAQVLYGDTSPQSLARVAHGHCTMGTFSNGGTVFNAASADWAYGLEGDPLVRKVTANVLLRLGADR